MKWAPMGKSALSFVEQEDDNTTCVVQYLQHARLVQQMVYQNNFDEEHTLDTGWN